MKNDLNNNSINPLSIKASDSIENSSFIEGVHDEGEDDNKRLGRRLRELRQERGLTIRDVSSKSGISVNAVSLIENGKSSPSVHTLHEISKVLKVPVAEFFNEKHCEKNVVYTQCAQHKTIQIRKTSMVRLSKGLVGNVLSCSLVTLPPAGVSGKAEVAHSGYEFAYCLKGKLLYTVEAEHYLLEPGDSIAFTSELMHHWQNLHNDEAQFLILVVNILPTSNDTFLDKHL